MDNDKKERIEKNKKKYIWLHRINISIFIFALFKIASRYITYPGIEWLFIPVVIGFLIYSVVKDPNFLFFYNFYLIVFLISGFGLVPGYLTNTFRQSVDFFGYFSIMLMLIVFIITFFIEYKVFEAIGKPEL